MCRYSGRCVGNTGAITSRGFPGFCLEDSPTGVRLADLVSVFPPAINAAATFDKELIRARGAAMGAEFKGKGVNFALGPVSPRLWLRPSWCTWSSTKYKTQNDSLLLTPRPLC